MLLHTCWSGRGTFDKYRLDRCLSSKPDRDPTFVMRNSKSFTVQEPAAAHAMRFGTVGSVFVSV